MSLVANFDITIIIPLFNKEHYVKETLDSILQNASANLEIVIIDDNSTDGSLQIARTYQEKFDHISVFQNNTGQKGGSICRNIGIEKAQGTCVIFLDADDLLSSTCIKNRLEIMHKNADLDFAVFPMGTFYKKIGDSNFIWNSFEENHLNRFLKHDLPWAIPCPIWKTSFLKRIGGFDGTFERLQDVELHTKVLLLNPNYKVFSNIDPDCFYRIDDDRIETNQNQFMERWLNGVCSYVDKFYSEDHAIFLRGTYLSFIKVLFYKKTKNQLSNDEAILLLNKIDGNLLEKLFSTNKSKKVLNRYKRGLNKSFFKIKGYNFIYSKMLMKN
jgi:glycosyltransferase involved in cell wall biosynthesis